MRYHIQITNTGSGYAGVYRWGVGNINVAYPVDPLGAPIPTTIQDTLPQGFSFAGNVQATINGAPITGMTVSALGNTITFTIPHTMLHPNEIPPGGVLDLFFDVRIDPALAPGIYRNNVYTQIPYNKKPKNKAPKPKDWARKPLYSVDVAPVSVGAVQLQATAAPSTVTNTAQGTSTNYTITIRNQGGTAITLNNFVLTHTLPAGFSYRAGSTGGTAGAGAPTITGQQVSWTIAALSIPAGGAKTITFTAVLPHRFCPVSIAAICMQRRPTPWSHRFCKPPP